MCGVTNGKKPAGTHFAYVFLLGHFERTRMCATALCTSATAHRMSVCAHAPLQLILCRILIEVMLVDSCIFYLKSMK